MRKLSTISEAISNIVYQDKKDDEFLFKELNESSKHEEKNNYSAYRDGREIYKTNSLVKISVKEVQEEEEEEWEEDNNSEEEKQPRETQCCQRVRLQYKRIVQFFRLILKKLCFLF